MFVWFLAQNLWMKELVRKIDWILRGRKKMFRDQQNSQDALIQQVIGRDGKGSVFSQLIKPELWIWHVIILDITDFEELKAHDLLLIMHLCFCHILHSLTESVTTALQEFSSFPLGLVKKPQTNQRKTKQKIPPRKAKQFAVKFKIVSAMVKMWVFPDHLYII